MASSERVTSAGAPKVAMVENIASSPAGVRIRMGTSKGLGGAGAARSSGGSG
ncbi:Uncharacterised protein [Mycobacteroides abscessus subsp. abscessus]|nr:Uncharacterised protein [Mycobacteroides abscessus subsp. abscessus]